MSLKWLALKIKTPLDWQCTSLSEVTTILCVTCSNNSLKSSTCLEPAFIRNVSHWSMSLSVNTEEVTVYFVWRHQTECGRPDFSVCAVNMTGQLLSQALFSCPDFWKPSVVYTYLFHLFPPKQLECKQRGNPSCESLTHTSEQASLGHRCHAHG